MEGIVRDYVFLILLTVGIYFACKIEFSKRKKDKYLNWLNSMLKIWIILFIYFLCTDVYIYFSFNRLSVKDIEVVEINKMAITPHDSKGLIDQLKNDDFTWINHPNVVKEDTIVVKSHMKMFKFLVRTTTNEGILVSRLKNEKLWLTNRNDNLKKYIK